MVEEAENVQKHCGQILFLSTNCFAFNCEFCKHDFFTLEALRAHLNEHFPELATIIKTEDPISFDNEDIKNILSDVNSRGAQRAPLNEYFLELATTIKTEDRHECITPEVQEDIKDILSDVDNPGSDSTVGLSTLNNNEITIKSEQSEGNERKRQPQRACRIQTTRKNVSANISKPKVHKEASSDDIQRTGSKVNSIIPNRLRSNDVKRHNCSICGKDFISPSRLDYHTREKHLPDTDPRRYLPCPLCYVKFKTYSQLYRHMNIHKENPTTLTCYHCQKQYKVKHQLSEHIRSHFGIKPFKCAYCTKAFSASSNKHAHEKTHQHQCRVCNKTFATYNSLRSHRKQHADAKHYNCSDCEKKFTSKHKFEIHKRENHLPDTDPRRYFPCEQCDVKCKKYKQLNTHRQLHRGPLTCDCCQIQFTLKSQLLAHLRKHFGYKRPEPTEKKFKCEFCPMKLSTQKQFNDHENIHTNRRPHQCRVCNKSFAAYSTLKVHVRMHVDEKRFQCSICEKKFICNSEVEHHIRAKHLPDTDPRRYFPCQLCDAKLNSYSHLTKHNRKHRTNPEIFTCDYCRKQFQKKESLRQHMQVHSGIKSKCTYCPKKFVFKSSRILHEWVCTERSASKEICKSGFECRFCSKRFFARTKHRNHENSHTGERSYQCSICPRNFTASTSLSQHLRQHK